MTQPDNDRYLHLERTIDHYVGAPLVCALTLLRRPVPPPTPIQASEVRRLLLIKLHGLGNLAMLLPSIRRLRQHFGAAEIDFLTLETNAELVGGMPEVTEAHYLDAGSVHSLVCGIMRTVPRLRRRAFDLIIDFEQFAYFSAILSILVGRRARVGFLNPTNLRHLAYTHGVPYSETEHMSHIFGRLVRAAGAESNAATSRRLSVLRCHEDEAQTFLEASGLRSAPRIAVLHPGSSPNLTLRRWPARRFAALGDLLVGRLGMSVIVTGGPGEVELVQAVIGGMTCSAANAAGRLSVLAFAALCARSELVVGNDTGSIQIASAMGTRTVGLYGPNTPFLYGPLGKNDLAFYHMMACSPCLKNINRKISRCTRALCIESITVEEVFNAIAGLATETGGNGNAQSATTAAISIVLQGNAIQQ